MKYFTGDQHLDDETGILKFCDRPFHNGKHMVSEIIHRVNEVVKPDDTLYHVGDITFKNPPDMAFLSDVLNALNGTQILILGNHDEAKPFSYIKAGFQSVHTSLEITIKDRKALLCNDPSAWTVVPQGEGTIFVCGHIHKLFKAIPCQNIINVGVDANNYYPISEDQIIDVLECGNSFKHKSVII